MNGSTLASDVLTALVPRVESLVERGLHPHLAVVIVGDDPSSHIYVRNKGRACARVGIRSSIIHLPTNTTTGTLSQVIADLNEDPEIHGILVQSPLPDGNDEIGIVSEINPSKDVDGFHPIHLGRLVQGDASGLLPCTPAGIMTMLDYYGVPISGRRAVVIGRSRIVGMPLALLLAQRGMDATVTIAHSRTEDVEILCREADLLCVAIGSPQFVQPDWVKEGVALIDVGINRIEDPESGSGSRLVGDIDERAWPKSSYYTPVPGGIGPMTVAMLLDNTVSCSEASL